MRFVGASIVSSVLPHSCFFKLLFALHTTLWHKWWIPIETQLFHESVNSLDDTICLCVHTHAHSEIHWILKCSIHVWLQWLFCPLSINDLVLKANQIHPNMTHTENKRKKSDEELCWSWSGVALLTNVSLMLLLWYLIHFVIQPSERHETFAWFTALLFGSTYFGIYVLFT